jgi:hypothetical protein
MATQGKKFGKIKNKYHIIDILSYAFHFADQCYLLFTSSRTLRSLLLSNYDFMEGLANKNPVEAFDFTHDHTNKLVLTSSSITSSRGKRSKASFFIVHNDEQLRIILEFLTIFEDPKFSTSTWRGLSTCREGAHGLGPAPDHL